MATKLKANEIIDIVTTLEHDSGMSALRADIEERHAQHAMTDIPWLPEHMTRGTTVSMLSPRINSLAQTVGADMASYMTTTTVIPGASDLQAKADKVEKRYALERAELFTDQIRARMRWSQFIRGYGVYKLNCGDVGTKHPWWVEVPDPLSCYFLMEGGPVRPSVMGRKFEQMARDARKYADQREKKIPKWDGKTWDFETLSDDVALDSQPFSGTNVKDQFGACQFYEYDDGYCSYVVAMNKDGKEGQVVWSRESLVGGTAYVIIPGHVTDAREPRERLLPFFWAPMNVQRQVDTINTIRATRSLNIKPQVLMERSPQLMQAAQGLGIMRPASPEQIETAGPDTIIELDGKPYFWELPDDKDLAALEQSKLAELESYISTHLSLTTAETVKESTVRGLQLAIGIRQRQQGPMLSYEDWGEAQVLKMWAKSITVAGGYGADEWELYAKDNKSRYSKSAREIGIGEHSSIKKADLEFEHDVFVTTASMTAEEKRAAGDDWAMRMIQGISTHAEGLDAWGYADREAQMIELAKDEGYKIAAGMVGPNIVAQTFEERMRTRAGIWIIPGMMPGPETQAVPTESANQFPVPQTAGVEGGSGAPPG